MALDFKKPTTIAQEYRQYLKALKPAENVDQKDSDWWVKSQALGGVASGIYGDQKKVQNDIFPQSARRDALIKHLETYNLGDPIEPQPAIGLIAVTGDVGTQYVAGNLFQYDPNGNTYSITETVTLTAATGEVPAESVNSGQDQNLADGATLSMPAPPVGHQAATVLRMSDGRNDETEAEIADRVLARIRQPIEGGNVTDYEQWAREASPSVTSSVAKRYPFGLGTMAVYITSGTTDIDAAVDAGSAVVREPSEELIAEVLAYLNTKKPATDCVSVFGPVEVEQDVTVRVIFASGNKDTVPAGQTLTQEQLVQREVSRALYKIPTGGRKLGDQGYIFASEIEEALDDRLSASPYAEGSDFQILVDREVLPLDGVNKNRALAFNQIAIPGTITVVEAIT